MAGAVLSRVRLLYHYLRGLYAVHDSAHDRAAVYMGKAIAAGELLKNTGGLVEEAYFHLARAYERLGKHDDAVATAINGLQRLEASNYHSENDRRYLRKYIAVALQFSDLMPTCPHYDITKVRKSLRRDFPMRFTREHLIGS